MPGSPKPTLAGEDAVQHELRTARIADLKITSWTHPGVLQATLERPRGAASAQVTMNLALDQNPLAHRRALALARLARELEMHVVPATIVRHVSTGELGAAFADEPDVQSYLAAHASIQNDGTVAALVMAPSSGDEASAWNATSRREMELEEMVEARSWAASAVSTEPLPNENKTLVRDYVEVLVLDYLSGNVMRRDVLFDETTSTLLLANNDGAFPWKSAYNVSRGEARLLDRLKPIVRFPRTLRDALLRFDRARAKEILTSGAFESWLLAPRMLVTLDERRATLLTLVQARVDAYGADVVLSL